VKEMVAERTVLHRKRLGHQFEFETIMLTISNRGLERTSTNVARPPSHHVEVH
jgi:hypothetical protein